MAIVLKTPEQIELMRAAGRIVADGLALARTLIVPGATTGEIDRAVEKLIIERGAQPVFKGYRMSRKPPYPSATCISVNEEVVHGIPGERRLGAGDVVSLDVGARLDGWVGDGAWTFPVGQVDEERARLLATGERCLAAALAAIRPGRPLAEVSRAIENCAREAGFAVVRSFYGHGVGRAMHEDPTVPNYVTPEAARVTLRPGMTFAAEPMLNAGTAKVVTLADQWTVVTADRRPSVHFEHTVAVTADGATILTQR